MRTPVRSARILRLEPVEARTLMAWKVLAADAETLTIGEPDDGDVGVLSYNPESERFLLDGADTGVGPGDFIGTPNVRVSAGGRNNTTFVIDASETGFPVTGFTCFGPGCSPPPGVHIEFDGLGNENNLRFHGHESHFGGITIHPFQGGLGIVSFDAVHSRNIVSYRNFDGDVVVENINVIAVDVSLDSIPDPMNSGAPFSRDSRQSIFVKPNQIIVREHPGVGTFLGLNASRVAETSTILRLNHEGVANIQILAGDGDDWVTVETAAASESETITDYRRVAVDGGEGHDILDVDGSPGDDLIEVTRFDPPCPRFTACGRLLLPPSGARVPPQGISWTSVIADNVEHKQVAAGAGNDWIYGSIDADVIRGEAGSDVILGDSGNDLLQGDDGDDYISGDEGDDYIRGSDGNDTLDGGAGNDELMGGSIVLPAPIEMTSTIPIPTVPETIIGYIDPKLAILWLLNAAPTLSNDGDDQLTGGDGDDLLFGTAGDNVLRGGRGNDVLIGASGNDHLDGGEGRNLLIGGLGSDTILSLGSDIVVTGTTTLDANQVALRAILAEWSVNRPKTVRIRNLSDGSGGGQRLNGDHFLSSAMFSGDGDTDRASARREIDWLLASDEDLVALPRPRRRRSAAFRR